MNVIKDYSQFSISSVTLKVDTIVGLKHKSAVITLVERLSKVIITLKPCGRQAIDIEKNEINGLNCTEKPIQIHHF